MAGARPGGGAACAGAAGRGRPGRGPAPRPAPGGRRDVALVLLGASVELVDRADVRGLGVLRASRDLLDAPGSSGAPAAAASAGEVGPLGVREGAWVRMSLGDGRAGWLPVAAVLPLDGA